MRPPHELMERLAAADPLPDAERLTPEEQQEADALLARLLATPVEPARRRAARARPRRWALVAAATTCAALAAFAAVNLLDSDTPGPSVIDLAVAAVSDHDGVYHVVQRSRVKASGFGSLPRDNRTMYVESWHTTDGRQHQKWFLSRDGRRGRFVSEFAGRRVPGRLGGPMLSWDSATNTIRSLRFGRSSDSRGAPSLDPFSDPGEGLRSLEAQGRLHVAGTVDVDGRRAYRLTSGSVEGHSPKSTERVDYLVDAETYLPLATHFTQVGETGNRFEFSTRYLVYERLPLDARSRAQLDLDPHPGVKCAPQAGEIMGRGSLGFPNPCAR